MTKRAEQRYENGYQQQLSTSPVQRARKVCYKPPTPAPTPSTRAHPRNSCDLFCGKKRQTLTHLRVTKLVARLRHLLLEDNQQELDKVAGAHLLVLLLERLTALEEILDGLELLPIYEREKMGKTWVNEIKSLLVNGSPTD